MTEVKSIVLPKGRYLERVPKSDSRFRDHNHIFQGQLMALYEISYDLPTTMGLELQNDMMRGTYYHGTGHCGCILEQILMNLDRVPIADWWCCPHRFLPSAACATRGILTHGHLLEFSTGGHYFSPRWTTAKWFSQNRPGLKDFLVIFICQARNIIYGTRKETHYLRVDHDHDILPVYLAVLKNEE
ncbi:hypothetical protein BGZ83_002792, partial [Gryganskiella cystojenkinii]